MQCLGTRSDYETWYVNGFLLALYEFVQSGLQLLLKPISFVFL